MKFFSPIEKTDTLFVLFGLSFILFGWFVFLLALSDLFLFPLIVSGAALVLAIVLIISTKVILRATPDFKIAVLISLFMSVLIGSLSVPTLFSGRDQGSIAEAATRLAHNGHLAFSTAASEIFFQIYGEGTALNFPGFAYTKTGDLITQFPLGYTAWLASFVSLFGVHGLVIGNSILLFLFLTTLYALLRVFVHPFYASAGLALAIFSFLPTWFAKVTLSENLALFLFVFLVWNLILFLQEGKFISYAGILLSGGLFAFTRIEGFAFLALAVMVLFVSKPTRHIWTTYPWKSIVLPGILFTFIFLRDFFINLPYYKMIGKALEKFLRQSGSGSVTGDLASTGGPFTLGSVFFLYGLLALFAFGVFGILIFIKEKRLKAFLPALVALPTFVYLFDPNISLDHPWMLRRYLFSLFPALLFSAVVGIALLFAKEKMFPIEMPQGKRLFFVSMIFLGLIALEYPAFSYGLPFAENQGLDKQIAAFSQEFSDTDLVLVDRNATGDGFAMLTGPAQYLSGKNMAYFFNPDDLARINLTPFTHTYLLVPDGDQARYVSVFGDRLVFKKTVTFSSIQLESTSLENNLSKTPHLPEKVLKETRNDLFQIY
ncbi:MAG: hypothetical protein WAV46_03550 [Candidatus Moraniibacteriota bacterium]